ncbi:MAG TPA: SRPBCC family protein [Draconibacterium sp.]|nr:SRPBCC family protein [Draconibacterium sp.]
MTQLKQSILIKAPVDIVFSYISDYRNWPEFYMGISDIKPITEKTNETGSKFLYKISSAGMTFNVGTELSDFKKNEGWIGKSFKGIDNETFWNVRNIDGDTEFTHGLTYHLPWFMGGKLLDVLFFKSVYSNTILTSLNNVKRILEEK